jgi:hypothetical protein
MDDTAQPTAIAVRLRRGLARCRPDAVTLVRVPAGGAIVLPSSCACCGKVATHFLREARHFGGEAVLLPYCSDCHAHASRDVTRSMAVSVSTVLVAVSLTAGIPLVFQPSSSLSYALLVVLGTFVPLVVARLTAERVAPGHAAGGRAAYFRPSGVLVCRSGSWASDAARASGATATSGRAFGVVVAAWALAALALCLVVVWPFYRLVFPIVRVVNTSEDTLTIAVDAKDVARVPATRRESPMAGLELRIGAGRHLLQAFGPDGDLKDAATVTIEAGSVHLYAPASEGTCFRIETTGYGQSRHLGTNAYPLFGATHFWVLPSGQDGIDYWFSPTPPPADDTRSTGGVVRALRQAPCAGGF